jgi:hypothetical protein
MAFEYTDRHRTEYITDGFTVLRSVIPASLLADLRWETDKAREIARRTDGPQAQRLQPVYAYDELNPRPFRDFLGLPGMRATVEGVLGRDHAESDIMGVLLEPERDAWCTHWHRDWAYNAAHVDLDEFFAASRDVRMFNQLNAALYDDHSLWVVPGSHDREDTADERAAFPVVPPPGPSLDAEMGPSERELTCLAYARRMPCAVPVQLFAGDVAFYRACQWHIGNYVPYLRRATLHDGFYCAEDREWQATVKRRQQQAR